MFLEVKGMVPFGFRSFFICYLQVPSKSYDTYHVLIIIVLRLIFISIANYVLRSLSIQALEGQNLKYFAGEHVVYMYFHSI